MLRQIFYVLVGGYFAAGVLIGLSWLTAVDSGRRVPTALQQEERVLAVQGTRTPGAESANVTDVVIENALTSHPQGGRNGQASLPPPPAAVLQSPHPDRRTARGPGNDSGTLGLGRPQSPGPQSLQAGQVDGSSSPTVRAIDQASIPHPRTDQTASTSIPQTHEAAQVDTGALPTVT